MVGLAGPTACGKTQLAHSLWRPGELLLNADSRQVYRGMDVATAKPGARERETHPWQLLDLCEPSQTFTAKAWLEAASRLLRSAQAPAWVVGGTAFYFELLRDGLFDMPEITEASRARLAELMPGENLDALREEVVRRDPAWAAKADLRNPRRLERAFLVMETAGVPFSEMQKRRLAPGIPCQMVVLFLPRKTIYNRIAMRVDEMLSNGLLDETKRLLDQGVPAGSPSMTGIGYGEAVEHLAGRLSLPDMKARMVNRTRQFARRQVGAFRRFKEALFVDVSGGLPTNDPEDAWFWALPELSPGAPIAPPGARLAPGSGPSQAIRHYLEVPHGA